LITADPTRSASTEDVRKAAGISGWQVYHYFDSKQALIRAVITRQAEAPLVPACRSWAPR
jgi:TetR/AcrR family transcriptional repressor of nem operon